VRQNVRERETGREGEMGRECERESERVGRRGGGRDVLGVPRRLRVEGPLGGEGGEGAGEGQGGRGVCQRVAAFLYHLPHPLADPPPGLEHWPQIQTQKDSLTIPTEPFVPSSPY